ncbi:tetratricopeptide repeat protein [Maridesulfovibrio ferrireducens]|uniref:tetratricopeptide repeat protein n=1 Tax=Maridesulfovibrio ferrireducens TaxID=246191 RepID=UPI001A19B36E|nr:tetratricopeptide repeat protein [Maridesulfovibrio ferrireducens]MBI9112797.1 tetratricopeptide repeat protein [Maridesulfovibrio ferrireducens]
MNKVERIVWIICFVVTLTILVGIIEGRAAVQDVNADVVTELSCGRAAQEYMDCEEYELAISNLEACLRVYPRSDWLFSLLGRAYYKMGDLEAAETQFRHALEINTNNLVAKRLILEMRKTQDLLKDRELSEWVGIAKERAADLITLVVGVWLGMLLSGISGRVYSHFMRTSFRKALSKKDYDYATDILEDLIVNRKKAELRKRLRELLQEYSLDEAKELIIEYVDDREIEDKLVHFLVQIHKKSKIS